MADYDVPTYTDFFTRFPTLDDGTAARTNLVTLLLVDAATLVDVSWRAVDYPRAIMYLVAHWLTTEINKRAAKSGPISSESFGPISVSYASVSTSMTSLGATEYGQRYLEYRKNNFPAIKVV